MDEKQTRRNFLKRTSLSAAVLTTVAGLSATACSTSDITTTNPTTASTAAAVTFTPEQMTGPIVAYISNPQTGEITVLSGTQQVVYRDSEFIQRIAKALQ